VPGMSYTAQTSGNAPWLSVSPQGGGTPGLLTVTANPFALAPGMYQATITVTVPLANPPVQTVSVQLTVGQAITANRRSTGTSGC
jgi:hypothetical protein